MIVAVLPKGGPATPPFPKTRSGGTIDKKVLRDICMSRSLFERTWLRCDCDQTHPPRDMADVRAISYSDTPALASINISSLICTIFTCRMYIKLLLINM